MSDEVWARLVERYYAYATASKEFWSLDPSTRIQLLRNALKSREKLVAMYLLQFLPPDQLVPLFDELVFFASFDHGTLGVIREAIMRMPRDWVLENIEMAANKMLENGTDDEYARWLELYVDLDKDMARRLVERALNSDDPYIREVGEDWVKKLNE